MGLQPDADAADSEGQPKDGEGKVPSRQAWTRARQAKQSNLVTRGFRTLRDMSVDGWLPFDRMHFVCNLGEGAFGQVEKRELINDDGSKAYVAIKRLKDQDVTADTKLPAPSLVKFLSVATTEDLFAPEKEEQGVGGAVRDKELEEMLQNLSDDDKKFVEEIEIMRRISHPYIIRYLGCGIIAQGQTAKGPGGKFLAVAQEVCQGGSLSRLVGGSSLLRKRAYAFQDALRWSTQIAKALVYLHEAHPMMIHRDLKADNILLTQKGRAADIRVMDFGLTKMRRAAKVGWHKMTEVEHDHYVMTGCTGSFIYMAPEVALFKDYNEKVDIFSLGVIMYELFSMNLVAAKVHKTGEPDEFEIYAKHVATGYREPIKETWPEPLKALVSSCWAQDPVARPSARDVVQALGKMDKDITLMDQSNPRPVMGGSSGGLASGACCAIF